tara:strand:+ start:79 stop:444 length:366 start_codon:yes stop_codon:yes gene_type:complete
MLKNLYNKIFKKNKDEVDFVSSLEIVISKDKEANPQLNVLLDDFTDESIEGLCRILTLCGNEYFFLNVVEVLREQFIANDKLEELETILVHITAMELKDKVKVIQNEMSQQPCIKPSDIQI